MNKSFWKEKRVLVTGHTGFKGSWLCMWLQHLGSNVLGFSDSIPTKPSMYEVAKIENGMNSVYGDIGNYNVIKKTIDDFAPDVVFHLAAQSLVRKSYDDPISTYQTNVMGTVNVLNSLIGSTCTRVAIMVTSDKCYDNSHGNKKFQEDDPMGGFDPYSNSKGCAELTISSFRNSFFNSASTPCIASVRAGNVIGGGDWADDRIIPDIIRSIYENKKLIIRHLDAIRPWQYILDPLKGYLILAEKMWDDRRYAEAWNFGPDDSNLKQVKWILDMLQRNKKINYDIQQDYLKKESNYLALDSSKAKTRLNWNPKISLDDAIKTISHWYHSFYDNKDMHKISLDYIKKYELT
ncbi:CDP-glucose 4,6-dehydratase [Nitrosopumilus sp. S4]